MSYCVSHMIGIRSGGVMSSAVDIDDMRARVEKVAKEIQNIPPLPGHAMSPELEAGKGSWVVIAGVFNSWHFDDATEFARRLSEEFGVEVMHMSWDEQTDDVQCQMYLAGRPLLDVVENPIGRILRRLT